MTTEKRYPSRAPFPATRRSAVVAARSPDEGVRRAAYETLIAAYWAPVYAYVRFRHGADPDGAKDLAQGFFAYALERGQLERYDPARASFRTYLRTCLDSYAANVRRAAAAERRGGRAEQVPLDEAGDSAGGGSDPEAYFHREWVRGLLALGVERLRERLHAQGKAHVFAIFERYDLDASVSGSALTYADLAETFGVPVTQVTNHLALARRELRAILLETLAQITSGDAELEEEARALFGRSSP